MHKPSLMKIINARFAYISAALLLIIIMTFRKYTPDFERDFLRLKITGPTVEQDQGYGVVLDCGSSGTRVYIYKWIRPTGSKDTIEIDHQYWELKESPGISAFRYDKQGLNKHLYTLIEYAQKSVPIIFHPETPIFLFATAGMRLLTIEDQQKIMSASCGLVKNMSKFFIESCDTNFRVISGELEGLFGWLTVNYLKTRFQRNMELSNQKRDTYGFIDIGGASAQIAFEPIPSMSNAHQEDLWDISIRRLDGTETDFGVFVGTFLGFGVNQARRRFIEKYSPNDACLPNGLNYTHTSGDVVLGSGNFDLCFSQITPLLNKHSICLEEPCLFNGLHAPILDFENHRFIGVSEVWYTTFSVYDLGGEYDYQSLLRASKNFCETPWDRIRENFSRNLYKNVNDEQYLVLHCFKSAYLLNVLHNGFSFPTRLSKSDVLQSSQGINGFSLSWTLGVIFMYASSRIPVTRVVNFADLELLSVAFYVCLFILVLAIAILFYLDRSGTRVVDMTSYHELDEVLAIKVPTQSTFTRRFW